jgi:predicted Zn-dependent peptidase
MTVQHYPQLNEQVITEVLPNGLTVVMIPKPDFHKTFAVLTTKFGAIDREFVLDGQLVTLPAGTAHFFEHKIFEKADGDAFAKFGEYGADANAFTNANETSYLFATTQDLRENLTLLLDFVQTPYFTQTGVDREQGIIGQEIQMYADDPNWALYSGILNVLYAQSVIADDVAGTVEDIAKITPELLYQVHDAFYQPDNLTLKIVGQFDPETVLNWIQTNQQAKFFATHQVERAQLSHTTQFGQQTTRQMHVARPKVAFGLRGEQPVPTGINGAKVDLALDLATDLLFGEQTDWYQDLYQRGIIDTEFSVEYQIERGYHFMGIFAETQAVDVLEQAIHEQLSQVRERLLASQSAFDSLRRATLGEGVQRLNSLESIALRSEEQLFDVNVFDEINLLQTLTFDEIFDIAVNFFTNTTLQRFVVTPDEQIMV